MFTRPKPVSLIAFDAEGRAVIEGTTYRVVELAMEHVGNGWGPDELCRQHYDEFSVAQAYAALSYYYEHRAEFDAEIERDRAEYDALLRGQAGKKQP